MRTEVHSFAPHGWSHPLGCRFNNPKPVRGVRVFSHTAQPNTVLRWENFEGELHSHSNWAIQTEGGQDKTQLKADASGSWPTIWGATAVGPHEPRKFQE